MSNIPWQDGLAISLILLIAVGSVGVGLVRNLRDPDEEDDGE